MCIAILKKEGAVITDEELGNCFDNNKDGAGLAYAKDGKLYYVKGLFDKKKFIQAVRKYEKEAQGAMLIHCRIGTSGLKDKNNCHPHVVNEQTVLIHNGVLQVEVPQKSKVSDTVIYIDKYLKGLPLNFMENDAICKLIERSIGSYNKFALLNNKGEYRIINERAGEWKDNVWYSNNSYSYNRDTMWCGYVKNFPLQTTLPFIPDKTVATTIKKPVQTKKYAYPVYDSEKTIQQIRQLSNFEIMDIGEYPVYDRYKQKLIPESKITITDEERYRYLDDLDDVAYEEYLAEIQLRGLINEFKDSDDETGFYRAI